jgi:L-ascorbate metabolism protein UlaG (beta-lactamase superfamily)
MADNDAQGSLLFIGNATVLLRYAGFTVLTDPNFIHKGESVPLGYGMSTERLTDPALEIDDLPPLDAVVLSHFHGDHFDQVAEERLDRSLPIVTTPEAARILEEKGFERPIGLATWDGHAITRGEARLRVTALPGKHAPAGLSVALPDVMGSCLEFSRDAGGPELRVYITGDTIMYEGLADIPARLPQIDLALLHLGGTRVMGLTVTMDAEQGLELLRTVRPELAVPIHYNDYEAFKSPIEDFQDLVRDAGLESQVRYLAHGETLALGSRTFERAR